MYHIVVLETKVSQESITLDNRSQSSHQSCVALDGLHSTKQDSLGLLLQWWAEYRHCPRFSSVILDAVNMPLSPVTLQMHSLHLWQEGFCRCN